MLRYMRGLQDHLQTTGVVGKSNSVADIVRIGPPGTDRWQRGEFPYPDSPAAVAQCLMQFQSSHRPDDLWKLVTPDYRQTSLWAASQRRQRGYDLRRG